MPATRIETPAAAGMLFAPRDNRDPLPLVLFGHGAHTGKDDPMMQVLCRGFARGVPAAVLCIDAPRHGERRDDDIDDDEFDRQVRAGMSDPEVHDEYVHNWKIAAAAARAALPIIDDRTAYVGFSMGAVFGLSIAHRLDVGAAVFALGGLRDPTAAHTNARRTT